MVEILSLLLESQVLLVCIFDILILARVLVQSYSKRFNRERVAGQKLKKNVALSLTCFVFICTRIKTGQRTKKYSMFKLISSYLP
jgi:hypothetical protein